MKHPVFIPKETWDGGFLELAIEVGPSPNDRLVELIETLWKNDRLAGCWLDNDSEPDELNRETNNLAELIMGGGHLYGVATLDNGTQLACGCCTVCEDDGSDWCIFYFPMGSVARAFPDAGGYPFTRSNERHPDAWLPPIEDWLARLGRRLFEMADFRLGLVGHEVSGSAYAEELLSQGIPAERWMGYLWPIDGQLIWHPRTAPRRPLEFE